MGLKISVIHSVIISFFIVYFVASTFPIWIPLISFFSDCYDEISKDMLNESGKSRHPCLVLDLRGNAFSFSLLSMMLGEGLSYKAFFSVAVCSFYAHFLGNFYYR